MNDLEDAHEFFARGEAGTYEGGSNSRIDDFEDLDAQSLAPVTAARAGRRARLTWAVATLLTVLGAGSTGVFVDRALGLDGTEEPALRSGTNPGRLSPEDDADELWATTKRAVASSALEPASTTEPQPTRAAPATAPREVPARSGANRAARPARREARGRALSPSREPAPVVAPPSATEPPTVTSAPPRSAEGAAPATSARAPVTESAASVAPLPLDAAASALPRSNQDG